MTDFCAPASDDAAWASLEAIADGDDEFMATLIQQYLDDSQVLVDWILPSIERGSASDLERSTHTLKSASANLGAVGLAHMCETLCRMARAGSLDGAVGLGQATVTEHERVRADLEARLQKVQAA